MATDESKFNISQDAVEIRNAIRNLTYELQQLRLLIGQAIESSDPETNLRGYIRTKEVSQ